MARVFLTFEAVPYSKREPLKFGPKTEILYNFPKRDEENLAFVCTFPIIAVQVQT